MYVHGGPYLGVRVSVGGWVCFSRALALSWVCHCMHVRVCALQPKFFQDPAHLAGSTGARVLAELVQHALDTTIQSLKDRPYTQEEEDVVMGPLPLPLYRSESNRACQWT